MKKLLVITAILASFAAEARREADRNGYVTVRTNTEAALEPALLDTADQINRGTFPRQKYSDDCSPTARRRVFSIAVDGKRYRSGSDGRLTPYWVGTIKYTCNR
ncbi:MAG: hypothetical protein KDD34_04390 [Bdellovibrionales bacterium]|nr:hypothetical protein [Bdellovibrionales bacterium]